MRGKSLVAGVLLFSAGVLLGAGVTRSWPTTRNDPVADRKQAADNELGVASRLEPAEPRQNLPVPFSQAGGVDRNQSPPTGTPSIGALRPQDQADEVRVVLARWTRDLETALRAAAPSERCVAATTFSTAYLEWYDGLEQALMAIATDETGEQGESWSSQEMAIMLCGKIRSRRALPFLVANVDRQFSRLAAHPEGAWSSTLDPVIRRSYCTMALVNYGAEAERAIQDRLRGATELSDEAILLLRWLVLNILNSRGIPLDTRAVDYLDAWWLNGGVSESTRQRFLRTELPAGPR